MAHNVIVVMVDDMRADDLAEMPQVRRIIGSEDGHGQRYDNAYVPTPLCVPSRCSFLTGLHTHNHQVVDNNEPDGGWQRFHDSWEETDTLPLWLQDAGYTTIAVGKYLNEYGRMDLGNRHDYVPPGWDSWHAITGTFADYDSADLNNNGEIQTIPEGTAYIPWTLTTRALRQLDRHLPGPNPVFMWLSYVTPHTDGGGNVPAAPEYRGRSTVGPPDTPAFDEADVTDHPAWVRDLPSLTAAEKDDIVAVRRQRRDALRTIDDAVAQVRDKLVEHGSLADTVLIFISDNGYMLGEHRIRAGKLNYFDQSARVPLLVRGPGFDSGTFTRVCSLVDVTATIVDVSGATPGHALDGRSLLWPPAAGQKRPVLIEKIGGIGVPPNYAAVRVNGRDGERWLYAELETGEKELFDGRSQTANHAGQPAYATIEASLADVLDSLRTCRGDSCDITWVPPA